MHMGNGHTLGERAGAATHTLTIAELPGHTHVVQGSAADGDSILPASGYVLAGSKASSVYGPANRLTSLAPDSISNIGGSQAHENRQPFLTLNFCIALQGIFPSQN